jgi:Xaa-Pro aminopeptidase
MRDVAKLTAALPAVPFDTGRLDQLLETAGIDVLISTSKHNVQYLLGGHRSIFFDYMDATGVSRYLPVLVYPQGSPDKAAYIGHRLESHQRDVAPFWTPVASTSSSGSIDAMVKAIEHVRAAGVRAKRIGVEMPFLPADAAAALSDGLPDSELKDAVFVLERLRAKKRPDELVLLKRASELVIESMLAVISKHGPGTSKRALFEALRREEVNRGMTFEYCLLTAGTSLNRAPSDERWEEGDIISLDSGGNYHGYIGDLCRMAIQGEPDPELEDLLAEIETIQRAAMAPIKAGAMGAVIYGAALPLLRQSNNHNHLHFLAHGMGLVSHEAPRLAPRGSMAYDPYDADHPLETGMVISVETTLHHPRRGFIKLEDTVAVTDQGFEIYGEGARGWNRGGTAVAS